MILHRGKVGHRRLHGPAQPKAVRGLLRFTPFHLVGLKLERLRCLHGKDLGRHERRG